MNVIFLDIDGVLNDFLDPVDPWYRPQIKPECVKQLNRIIDATGAKLVISSSWRYLIHNGHFSVNGFELFLKSHGVRAFVIGCTREDMGFDPDSDDGDEPRWKQIAHWLQVQRVIGRELDGAHCHCQGVAIDSYCILDDDPDAFGGRNGIRTNSRTGLTDKDADTAIEILNGLKRRPANDVRSAENRSVLPATELPLGDEACD